MSDLSQSPGPAPGCTSGAATRCSSAMPPASARRTRCSPRPTGGSRAARTSSSATWSRTCAPTRWRWWTASSSSRPNASATTAREFTELDTDAVIARHPHTVLVDELAHTNVPGTRHEKRWQSVEEILAAGINVLSTVNVQHFESLNDTICQITGVCVRETVPDRVLDEADEVELVDIPPDALLNRLKRGAIYAPEKVDQALNNFFRRGNLVALREMALAQDRRGGRLRSRGVHLGARRRQDLGGGRPRAGRSDPEAAEREADPPRLPAGSPPWRRSVGDPRQAFGGAAGRAGTEGGRRAAPSRRGAGRGLHRGVRRGRGHRHHRVRELAPDHLHRAWASRSEAGWTRCCTARSSVASCARRATSTWSSSRRRRSEFRATDSARRRSRPFGAFVAGVSLFVGNPPQSARIRRTNVRIAGRLQTMPEHDALCVEESCWASSGDALYESLGSSPQGLTSARGGAEARGVRPQRDPRDQGSPADLQVPRELLSSVRHHALDRRHPRVRRGDARARVGDLRGHLHQRRLLVLAGVPRREGHRCPQADDSAQCPSHPGREVRADSRLRAGSGRPDGPRRGRCHLGRCASG